MFINITDIRYENIKGTDAASIDKNCPFSYFGIKRSDSFLVKNKNNFVLKIINN